MTIRQIVFGFVGLICALNAIFVTVGIIRAGRDAISKGDGGLDVGLFSLLITLPCFATALAVYFFRLALKSRRP
jgi:hypothetical protein